jgi:3'-phosphoadenosine 5'-phosphosulfate sulfotransferase (PAPS reductase)/FAD synthetase
LRPIHYASVSGGKDSLYMLRLILTKQDKYPLDMVVHFELEIDWDWSKKVIDEMERICQQIGLKFVRIKPRKTWEEIYNKYGFPNARARWCNNIYKLDCKKQLNEWIKSQNCRPVAYIGFCADETDRFKYEIGNWDKQDCCYPLAEEGIEEKDILEWAKNQDLLKDYYKYFKRQGCTGCPMATMKEWAYLYQKEPDRFEYYMQKIRETEIMIKNKGRSWQFKNIGVDEFERRIKDKWIKKLENEQLIE